MDSQSSRREEFTARLLIESSYPLDKVSEIIAGEQSSGTFISLPGESAELKDRSRARVISITEHNSVKIPSLHSEFLARKSPATKYFRGEVEIAFPTDNIGFNIPALLTTVAGNLFEIGEVTALKLLDVDFPESFAQGFMGPQFGIEGTRELCGVQNRPIIGTIIKPSIGMMPDQTASVVDELCAGRIDFIKDDELTISPNYANFDARLNAVMPVIKEHADRLGRMPMYAINISGSVDEMRHRHDAVLEAGGTCIMLNLNWVGHSAVEYIRKHSQLPIHGHRNGWGALTRHPSLGFSFTAYQKIWRLCGIDHLHVNGIRSKFWEPDDSVIHSASQCLKSFSGVRPIVPVFSSGQWAGMAPDLYNHLQSFDLMHLAGAGIIGHPGGIGAGVQSMTEGWEAAINGIPLHQYAKDKTALSAALDKFGSKSMSSSQLKLAFYGDDFTGSSDALEVLASAGLKCAMFLQPPSAKLLQSLGGFDAIGVAGNSRTMSPDEMDNILPEVLTSLKELSPQIVHYKVCSTFDSAQDVGSIGHVISMGSKLFDNKAVPVVAGTPTLGRYCIFGNLFALSKTDHKVHRIDCHPVMQSHPITPMYEANLARNISEQKTLNFAHINILDLDDEERFNLEINNISDQVEAILFDGYTKEHLTAVGKYLTESSLQNSPIFTVGSSGVEYGLTQYWQSSKQFRPDSVLQRNLEPVEQLMVVSGSASPLSALQIEKCIEYGFKEIAVDARALVSDLEKDSEAQNIINQAIACLKRGENIVIHTARGSDDKRIEEMLGYLIGHGISPEEAKNQGGKALSIELGRITQSILENYALKRVVLSGGDTSSQVTKTLSPDALVIQSCISPGAPLCKALSDKPFLSELELALKGGQMGDENYFITALTGVRV